LLVPVAAVLLHVLGPTPAVGWVWLPGSVAVFCGLLWWQQRRRPELELSRELDRRFGLDELLVTAVEVDRRGPGSPLEERLLDDAASAVTRLSRDTAVRAAGRQSGREAETLLAIALILAGLWLLAGTLGDRPAVARLPALLDGAGGLPGGGEGPGANVGQGAGAAAGGWGDSPALGTLASALGDYAAAREVAAALRDGDPAAAARAARALASQAHALSAGGRAELADALHRAADELDAADPELGSALHEAGRDLESPRPDAAAAGVGRLAAALDELAFKGTPGSGARPTTPPLTRSGPPAVRLVVEPALAELAVERAGAAALSGPAPATSTAMPADQERRAHPLRGSAPAGGAAAIGADPLRYPWPLRETVRRYFEQRMGSGYTD
jgi:hypothetical protein